MALCTKLQILARIGLSALVTGAAGTAVIPAHGAGPNTETPSEAESGKSAQDESQSPSYRFDFGSKDSQTFPGFTPVAAEDSYDATKGYGWGGTRESYARIKSPIVNPDPLAYDFVYAEDATFELNLPNGDYEVALLCGDIGTYKGFYSPQKQTLGVRTGYRVIAQGMQVVDVAGLDEESYRQWLFTYADDDWQPGYDVWDRYIAPRYTLHHFPVSIQDGKLALAFRHCPVNMLAVYPTEYKAQMVRELEELDEQRRSLFPYREIKYPHQGPLPVLSKSEKERGYLVFVKHYLDEVFPDTVPRREEMVSEIGVFAAANEYEPVSFAIHALEGLQRVEVSVTDLMDGTGATIPASDVAVQFVRYVEIAEAGPKAFRLCPHILMERESVDIAEGTSKSVWLTIHVREGTPAGRYRGEVTITPAGRGASKLELVLQVLAFSLPERVAGRGYAILANWPPPLYYGNVWESYAKRFPVLKAHGMETLYIGGEPFAPEVRYGDAKVELLEMEFLEDTMSLYRSAGLGDDRVLWNTAFDLEGLANELAGEDKAEADSIYCQLVRLIDERARQRGWPRVFYTKLHSDSVSSPEGELPHVELVASAGVKTWQQQSQGAAIRAFAGFTDLFLTKSRRGDLSETLEFLRKTVEEVGFHNYALGTFYRNRLQNRPLLSGAYRFFWGWWFWRTGAQVMGDEFHEIDWYTQPYNPFDSTLTEGGINDFCGVASPSPSGPRPHTRYEWMREGRDDLRYICVLEDLIARAKRSDSVEAKRKADEAERFLRGVADSIRVELYHDRTPDEMWWPLQQYDRHRWTVASYITELARTIDSEPEGE